MTCLYCGKKLGFFSRYKDTPFCSEEHLRTHQDELERALMERLGSKSTAPTKSLSDLANAPAPPLKSMLGLEAATRGPEAAEELERLAEAAPPPVQKLEAKQPEAPVEEEKKNAPAPLHEDYLFELPDPVAALDTNAPLVPPSSFAIIVQADCCTPSLPEAKANFGFELDETEFEFETTSMLRSAEFAAPPVPAAFGADGFGEPWVEFPSGSNETVQSDFDFDPGELGELAPLEYEAVVSTIQHTALGHRDEIEARIRLRYPYAASQVSSNWNGLQEFEESFPISDASDWAPIVPQAAAELPLQEVTRSENWIEPHLDVPLSIQALVGYQLEGADSEEFGDSLRVMARQLSASSPASPEIGLGSWAPELALPKAAVSRNFAPKWKQYRSSDSVPPVPFPSLFQLGPVLPPRPESAAG
jgi:hypothetical protein